MKKACLSVAVSAMAAMSFAIGAPSFAAEAPAKGVETFAELKVPVFSPLFDKTPVARVDSEVITLDQLNKALASAHEARGGETKGGARDFTPVLDRLINTRLIILEAHDTGIDGLPEFKNSLDEYKGSALREMLKKKVTKDVKPDKEEVEKVYRELVREWKIRSVVFRSEADAKKMSDQIKGGKTFDELAKQAVADKKAKGGEPAEYLSAERMMPPVVEAVTKMKPGSASGPVRIPDGYAIISVEDIRYPDNPKSKAEAERQSLEHQQFEVLQKYYNSLVKKYVKIDKKLLKALDFEAAEPGFKALMSDKRKLAVIKGEKPITVADLADELAKKFFHGVERAAQEKKLNSQKEPVFNSMLYKTLFNKEAARQGIKDEAEYKDLVEDYRNSILFSTFVQKVVVPDVKVTEDKTKDYYEQHGDEFTYPELMKLYSIGFADRKDAQSALDKLRAGTDFKWLKANAEGQLKEEERTVSLEGETLSVKGLPQGVAETLSGAKAGDYRLYESPEGKSYVLYLQEEVPAKKQPYKEAREAIAKKLFAEALNKSIEDWGAKLRAGHEVRIYITHMGS